MSKEGLFIKEKIDFNNKRLEEILSPNIFTLNNAAAEIIKENYELQQKCKHEYEDGFCVYCYKIEEE